MAEALKIAGGLTHLGRRDRTQPRRAAAMVTLFVGAVAVGTDGFMIAGLLPAIARDLSSSTAVTAQLVSVFALTYALGAPLIASLLTRAPRRGVLLGALAGLCASNVLGALAPSLATLFIARVTAAAAASQYTPTAALLASQLAPAARRGRALGLVTAGLTLSIVSGVPLGALLASRFGWRSTFVAVALLSALVALLARAVLPRSGADPLPARAPSLRHGLLSGRVVRVLATTLLGIVAGYLAYTYVAPISRAAGASGSTLLAIVLAGFGVGALCGALLSGLATDRFGQPRTVRAGAVGQAAALVALAVMAAGVARPGIAAVVGAFAALGAGSFAYNAPQQHRLIELAPDQASVLVSLNSSAIYAGIGLSGLLGGLALQFGPATNCALGAVIALLSALIAAPRGHAVGPARSRPAQGEER
jgi:DHA1 family inner membrane transport protein